MVYRKRTQRGSQFCHRAERHQLSARRRRGVHVQRRKLVGVSLIFRFQFQDHPILVIGRENRGNLPLPVGGIQRVLDLVHGHAKGRGRIAVDVHVDLRIPDLQIAADVHKPGQFAHLRRESLSGSVQLRGARALDRELVQCLALHAADADRGIVPQIGGHAGHGSEFGAQLIDHLVHLRAAARATSSEY